MTDRLLHAISYAAQLHHTQMRKDGKTPYAAHPFRVMMIARHVFGISDEDVLIAAVLHDTLEDTPCDPSEIEKRFGGKVTQWVKLLTKDMRLEKKEQEAKYHQVLKTAPEEVKWIKLADIFDNLNDCVHLSDAQRAGTYQRSRDYLKILSPSAHPLTAQAIHQVEEILRNEVKSK